MENWKSYSMICIFQNKEIIFELLLLISSSDSAHQDVYSYRAYVSARARTVWIFCLDAKYIKKEYAIRLLIGWKCFSQDYLWNVCKGNGFVIISWIVNNLQKHK